MASFNRDMGDRSERDAPPFRAGSFTKDTNTHKPLFGGALLKRQADLEE